MKVLAIDPGTKRMGLAICDELGLSIRCLPQFLLKGHWFNKLVQIIQSECIQKCIIGLPLNMDGSEGKAALRSRNLQARLHNELNRLQYSCEVILWDERLTSFEAERRLRAQGISKKKSKDLLDAAAAKVLLEDYLLSTARGSKQEEML